MSTTYIIYTDRVQDDCGSEYTHKYLLKTAHGNRYYGLRTTDLAYSNINLSVTNLNVQSEQECVYFFNQEYLFRVNKNAAGKNLFNGYYNSLEYYSTGEKIYPYSSYTYMVGHTVKKNHPNFSYLAKTIPPTDTTYKFDISYQITTDNTYVRVKNQNLQTIPTENLYEEEYIPISDAITYNYFHDNLYTASLIDNCLIYNRCDGYITKDNATINNAYVRKGTFTQTTEDKLSFGDECFTRHKFNNNYSSYICQPFGINYEDNKYYAYTYIPVSYKDAIIGNNKFYIKKENYKHIDNVDDFNNLIKNQIPIYTFKNAEQINVIKTKYNDDVTTSDIYEDIKQNNKVLYYKNDCILSLSETLAYLNGDSIGISSKGNEIISGSYAFNVNFITYLGSYFNNDLYYAHKDTESFFEIDNSYVVLDSNMQYYYYDLATLNVNKLNNVIASTDTLYGNATNLYYASGLNTTYQHTTINNNIIYCCEIDKTTGIFANEDLYTFEGHFKKTQDIEKSNAKNYYQYICGVQNITLHDIYKSDFPTTYTYTVNNATSEYTVYSYILSKIENDSYIPFIFASDPTYTHFFSSSYFYDYLTVNNGVTKNNYGTDYVTIDVYDPTCNYKSVDLAVKTKTRNNNKYSFDVTTYSYTQLTKTSQIVSTNQHDYYKYDKSTYKYTQLTNLDETPAYYLLHNEIVCTKDATMVNIQYKKKAEESGDYTFYKLNGDATPLEFESEYYGIYATDIIGKTALCNNGYWGKKLEFVELYFHEKQTNTSNEESNNAAPSRRTSATPTAQNLASNVINYGTDLLQSDALTVTNFSLCNQTIVRNTGEYYYEEPKVVNVLTYDENGYSTQVTYEGGWKEKTEIVENRFAVNAYVVQQQTDTTNFVNTPTNKLVSAVIEYPQISYTSKYTYSILDTVYTYRDDNGIKRQYTNNDVVVELNNMWYFTDEYKYSYYGVVKGSKVKLTKSSQPKQITAYDTINIQDKSTEYRYFEYPSAIHLANEVEVVVPDKPIANPSVEKEYVIKTKYGDDFTTKITTSYSYLSYDYTLKPKPFITNSYINQYTDFSIAYMKNISDDISTYLTITANKMITLSDATSTYGQQIASNVINLSNNIATTLINSYNIIDNGFNNIDHTIDNQSKIQQESIKNHATYVSTYINKLNDDLQYGIDKQINANTYNVNNVINKLGSNSYDLITYISYLQDTIETCTNKKFIGDPIQHISCISIKQETDKPAYIETTYGDTIESMNHLLNYSMMHTGVKKIETTYADGTSYTDIKYSYYGIADLLAKINHIDDGRINTPYKNEFIVKTSQKLFTAIDYETEIIDSVEYDENGNIINKITHKNNPYEMAKHSIARANILWGELVKGGWVANI